MPKVLYNEGRVVGLSAYELYIKAHRAAGGSDDTLLSETDWAKAAYCGCKSAVLKLNKITETVTEIQIQKTDALVNFFTSGCVIATPYMHYTYEQTEPLVFVDNIENIQSGSITQRQADYYLHLQDGSISIGETSITFTIVVDGTYTPSDYLQPDIIEYLLLVNVDDPYAVSVLNSLNASDSHVQKLVFVTPNIVSRLSLSALQSAIDQKQNILTAGEGINIEDATVSADLNVVQHKLTAGSGIGISEQHVIQTAAMTTMGLMYYPDPSADYKDKLAVALDDRAGLRFTNSGSITVEQGIMNVSAVAYANGAASTITATSEAKWTKIGNICTLVVPYPLIESNTLFGTAQWTLTPVGSFNFPALPVEGVTQYNSPAGFFGKGLMTLIKPSNENTLTATLNSFIYITDTNEPKTPQMVWPSYASTTNYYNTCSNYGLPTQQIQQGQIVFTWSV